jgi:hypothetical protein
MVAPVCTGLGLKLKMFVKMLRDMYASMSRWPALILFIELLLDTSMF